MFLIWRWRSWFPFPFVCLRDTLCLYTRRGFVRTHVWIPLIFATVFDILVPPVLLDLCPHRPRKQKRFFLLLPAAFQSLVIALCARFPNFHDQPIIATADPIFYPTGNAGRRGDICVIPIMWTLLHRSARDRFRSHPHSVSTSCRQIVIAMRTVPDLPVGILINNSQ